MSKPVQSINDPLIRSLRKVHEARLCDYTTFRLGGACQCFIDCADAIQLRSALEWARSQEAPHVLIGGGSNLLVSDQGYPGTVIRYFNPEPDLVRDGCRVTVSGSTGLDELAEALVQQGLDGLLCISGIPGTVGGAVVGNAGAWGEQIGDRVEAVHLLAPDGTLSWVAGHEMDFAYRRSRLQQSGEVVLAVRLLLDPGPVDRLQRRRDEILAHRASRHPDLARQPCAGSFFRNIEASSAAERRQAAGYFLEKAGVKAWRVGGAHVFARHANIIINATGTAEDVYALQGMMAARVREAFGLNLVREVRFLGSFKNEDQRDGFF